MEYKREYHHFLKSDPYLRQAIYECYDRKCEYCNRIIAPHNMEIDHILASKRKKSDDDDLNKYINELNKDGFILDSIENYFPSCPRCNSAKGNRNYISNNLRAFHQKALFKSEDVLKKIHRLQKELNNDFDKYDPEFDYWEKVNFGNQRDISSAIAGIKLGPNDVKCCPQFSQVKEIIEKLEYLNYISIKGKSGIGKSITLFQVAYEFYKKGWIVFQLKEDNIDECYLPKIEDNTIVLIDDAQYLNKSDLNSFIQMSNKNVKLLYSFTYTGELKNEDVLLIPSLAIDTLYDFYKKNEIEITKIVNKMDKSIGFDSISIPLSRRLENARQGKTPYQFNYIVRGGWNSLNAICEVAEDHNDSHIILFFVSLLQIFSLDKAVDKNELEIILHKYDEKFDFNIDDIVFLRKNKILLEKELKIIHLQTAIRILNRYIKSIVEKNKSVIRNFFIEKLNKGFEKGFIWMVDSIDYRYVRCIFDIDFMDLAFDLDLHDYSSEDRGNLLLFWSRVYSHFQIADKHEKYLMRNKKRFADWISNVTDDNITGYSNFINTMINMKQSDNFDLNIYELIDFESILKNFSLVKIESYYLWGYFWERLLYENCKTNVIDQIIDILKHNKKDINSKNIEYIIEFLMSIFYYAEDFCAEYLLEVSPILQKKFISDISYFLYYINRMEYSFYVWNNSNLSEVLKRYIIKIVKMVPAKFVFEFLNKSTPKEWDMVWIYYEIICKLDMNEEIDEFLSGVDINKNPYSFELWANKNYDLFEYFMLEYEKNIENARMILASKKTIVKDLSVKYISLFPDLCVDFFNSGVNIHFENYFGHSRIINAIKGLLSVNSEVTLKILCTQKNEIVNFFEYNNLDLEDDEYLNFIEYLSINYPIVLSEFIPQICLDKCCVVNFERFSFSKDEVELMKRRSTKIQSIYLNYK